MTENFNDFSFTGGSTFLEFHNSNNDLLPRLCIERSILRYKNIPMNTLVIWDDERIGSIILKLTNQLLVGTLDDFHHFPFQAASRRTLGDNSYQYCVSIHCAFQIVRVYVNITLSWIIGNEKTEAFGMCLQLAAQQI